MLAVAGVAQARTVNLDQAVHMALQADPRVKEREQLVDAARALLQEAAGHRDLGFDVNAFLGLAPGVQGGFFQGGADSCTTLPCTPRSDAYHPHGVSSWTGLQFKIIKPLYTFGKIRNYAAAAQGNIDVKRADVRIQRINTRLQVMRAYYGYLTARDTRYLLEDVKSRLKGAVDLVQRWLKEGNGRARLSDLYALQTGQALVNKYLAQAQAVEKIALDGLKVLTGVGLHHELQVADQNIQPVAPPTQTLAEMEAQALAQRPEIAQLTAGLSAQRHLVAAHKAEKLPNLYAGVVGTFSYAPGRTRLDNPFIYDPFNSAGLTPVIGVKWDWESGVQPARVARAQAQLNALVQKAALAQQGIPFQVAEAYHRVRADHTSVEQLALGSQAARRWMITSYADFQAGFQKPSKVLEAFKAYVEAQSDYYTAVNDYDMQVAELKRMTGAYQ
ncbi:MAG: TolC family protein [Gammaproteobacteria bacterium]|nr:TolC family protein [Gammaproteobacteria bacterium]